jgi:hypothetical protein
LWRWSRPKLGCGAKERRIDIYDQLLRYQSTDAELINSYMRTANIIYEDVKNFGNDGVIKYYINKIAN